MQNSHLSTYCQNLAETTKFKPNQTLFSDQKSYFIEIKNRNFSILWLKWTPEMEMKQNETFLHGTSYLFLSKIIKVFQWLSKSKFLSFMAKVNSNNWSETKSDISPWDILKSDINFHRSQNTKIFQWLL